MPLSPPATRTRPLGRRVAVWPPRAAMREPVVVQRPVAWIIKLGHCSGNGTGISTTGHQDFAILKEGGSVAVAGGDERLGGSPGINSLDCLGQDEAQGQGYEKQGSRQPRLPQITADPSWDAVMRRLPYFRERVKYSAGNKGLIDNLLIRSLIIFTSNLSVVELTVENYGLEKHLPRLQKAHACDKAVP